MSQLYARVFTTILDSSIAEDYETRHVFEDLLKVCTIGENGGIVDMTRQALSRKFNLPLEKLNAALEKLESPDPNSRSQDHDGRRIERLNEHRDWGWQILNWKEYEKIKTRADVAARVARHRAAKVAAEENPKEDVLISVEPSNTPESIYDAYPKKVGKPKALVAIKKAVGKYGHEFIMEKTKAYSLSRQGEDHQFTPNPSTWFNQERFNDELSKDDQLPYDPTDKKSVMEWVRS
jgi:hypothetical protein